MILNQYEKLLQQANPSLRIKRYGTSKAGIHKGTQFVCRLPQGEIDKYNVTRHDIGYDAEMITPDNPKGQFGFERLMARGRMGVARLLYSRGLIKESDIPKLS